MFCPKCATQNLDGASFCRSCGANISLVPQALTGQLVRPSEETNLTNGSESASPGKPRRPLTLDSAFRSMFMGFAFLLIAIALSRTAIGVTWWFWMLIPAFSLMGTGIAQYIRIRDQQKHPAPPALPRPTVRPQDQLMSPPASVTEGTTRHLSSKPSEHR